MTALVDTNFLVSVLLKNDVNHTRSVKALADLKRQPAIVAASVLVEVFYLLDKYAGYQAAIASLREIRRLYTIEPLSSHDMQTMEAFMTRYNSARFDYVDTAIMALAERMKIEQIFTYDRRDFVIFRPTHCAALELLP